MSWTICTLNDICDKANGHIQTGPFGSQLHQSDYSKTGTPVVMPKDIVNGTISEENIARISDEHVLRLSRHQVKTGDILFSRRGDVGRCAYISKKEQGWLCGTGCLRVTVDTEIADSKFIFYYLQQPSSIGWIEKHAIGATMLNLNTGILANVPIMLPSLPAQRRIASILSAYDDLIENNQKQIKLLEEAAQRLYKEWFVDLRFPGWENTKIVDGVPEGWHIGLLSELISVNYGKDHKKVPNTGDIPIYGSGGIIRKCDKALYSGESILIPRKGSLNNIMYVNESFWTVDTMFFTIPKKAHSAIFTYFFVSGIDMYSFNIGAAVPSMTVKILDNLSLIIPDSSFFEKFDMFVQPYFKKIKFLKMENDSLIACRNNLLYHLFRSEL